MRARNLYGFSCYVLGPASRYPPGSVVATVAQDGHIVFRTAAGTFGSIKGNAWR